MNKILKLNIVCLFTSLLNAGEIEIGKGTVEMSGGFAGLDQAISADVTTYSMVEQHKNFGSSKWFYKYNFTWYDSADMIQAQNTTNNTITSLSTVTTLPTIDYRLQGLDLNFVLGKDLIHKNENNYLSAGLLLGLSIPWIDSKEDDDSGSSNNTNTTAIEDSKTTIYTYKIGPNIAFRQSLNKYFSIYGYGSYAFQNATIKNDYLDSDISVNGTYQEYDIGIRFQPLAKDYYFDWITISPRLYATLGYRYTSLDLDDVSINIVGSNYQFTQTDFNMNSKITYFGLGYSF